MKLRTWFRAWATVAIGTAVAACDMVPATPGGMPPAALEAVTRDLLDPFSAEFRDVRRSFLAWCGQVNAKNRFGAYAGWKTFRASIADAQGETWSAVIAEDPSDTVGC